MFKIEIDNIKQFTSIIDVTSKIVAEIKFTADREGLRYNQLDKDHISFINLETEAEYYSLFDCPEPVNFIVDSKELLKILKRGKNDDTLRLTLDEGNLIIAFIGEAKRTFKIRLIDLEYESPSMPDLNYPVTATVEFKDFVGCIKDSETYSEKFKIKTNDYGLLVSCDNEFGEYEGELSADVTYSDGEDVYSSVFSIPKIKEFLSLQVDKDLTLKLGNDMPLTLLCEDYMGLKVGYLIAPRIESD